MSDVRESRRARTAVCYSTRQVAKLLDLDRRRLYSWIASGMTDPEKDSHGRYRFSFQDLVILKTAKGLLDMGISFQRVRSCIRRLETQLSPQEPLTGVQIYACGTQLVARKGPDVWEPESGQLLLNFQVSELAASVTRLFQAS